MRVVLAAEAEADLAQIADHIAADSPARAVVFLSELRQRCEELAATPHAFPFVPRYELWAFVAESIKPTSSSIS